MKPGFLLEENDERLALMALKTEKLSEQVENIDHRLKQTEEEVKYWLSYQCFIFRKGDSTVCLISYWKQLPH